MKTLTTRMRIRRREIGSSVSLSMKVRPSSSSSAGKGSKSNEEMAAKMALQAKLTMWGKHLHDSQLLRVN